MIADQADVETIAALQKLRSELGDIYISLFATDRDIAASHLQDACVHITRAIGAMPKESQS